MANIGLVARDGRAAILDLIREIHAWVKKNSHNLYLSTEVSKLVNLDLKSFPIPELLNIADPIITLGGDGTLIGTARHVDQTSPTMIGVNFGNLGFLTEIHPNELLQTLDGLFLGQAKIAERSLIYAEVLRAGKVIFASQAINDIVLQKDVRGKLLNIDVFSGKQEIMRMRGDGLIFATPTGSTAYSMSAGGSIVHPALEVILLSPICPHSLSYRPLILPATSELRAQIPEYQGQVFISVDGQQSHELQASDIIRLKKGDNKVKFVQSATKNYFDILRTKLNWGRPNSAE